MRVANNDQDVRAELRGYVQLNKYAHTHTHTRARVRSIWKGGRERGRAHHIFLFYFPVIPVCVC